MSPTPHEKGDVLEAAVAAIEGCILATSPALRDKTFIIESKKIINVRDVHHEIDIFVTFDLGRGYQSIFIFECKNWQDSVGKNEIIILSEKVDAAGATKGFLVAKSLTKDAHAQATKDTRLSLLTVAEHDPAATPIPFDLHTIITIPQHVDLTFYNRGSSGAGDGGCRHGHGTSNALWPRHRTAPVRLGLVGSGLRHRCAQVSYGEAA